MGADLEVVVVVVAAEESPKELRATAALSNRSMAECLCAWYGMRHGKLWRWLKSPSHGSDANEVAPRGSSSNLRAVSSSLAI